MNTAWTCKPDGSDRWVIIGLHDDVLTEIKTEKEGLGSDIVTEGELYNHVREVNYEKNKKENDSS